MKKSLICLLLINLTFFCFSLSPLAEGLKSFDSDLAKAGIKRAETTIGFITYSETDSCGSIVPYLQKQIKEAANECQRIQIVDSVELDESEQSLVATRGIYKVNSVDDDGAANSKFVLNGRYSEKGKDVELRLELFKTSGDLFSSIYITIPASVIKENNLTLYPVNRDLSQMIQKDFEASTTGAIGISKDASKIRLIAAMMDKHGNMVNMLKPNDIVKFKIRCDTDCYISILCIDANGVKQWLPINNQFMEAGTSRYFPDFKGQVLKVADDGVFGAEQIIIYASTEKSGLPPTVSEGKYNSQDLQAIMRNQRNVRQNANFKSGNFKITYTIVEK